MIDPINYSRYQKRKICIQNNLNDWIEQIILRESNKLVGFKSNFSMYTIDPYQPIYTTADKIERLDLVHSSNTSVSRDIISDTELKIIEKFVSRIYNFPYHQYYLNPFNLSFQLLCQGKIPSKQSGKILFNFEILALSKQLTPKIILQRNTFISSLGCNQYSNPLFTILNRKTGSIITKETTDIGMREAQFTKRELEIKKLLANGLSSRAIAINLGLSKETVSTHRKNIKRKEYAATL
ncbi:response regulator transcription factor [Marivirga sp.]|uniref:response regulator transcription factor n=1 Tax=Marivirga sp. TaxID=2018662 RepID=UPI003DA7A17D